MKLIKIFGFLLFLLVCHLLQAQEEAFRIGFQLHPGFSWIKTNELSVSSVGTNVSMGLAARGEFGISEHISLSTGLGLMFNRGGTLRHETGGNFFPESRLSDDAYNTGQKPLPDGTKLKYNLQYVDVPVALKWHSKESGLIRYFVEAPVVTWSVSVQRRGAIKAGDIDAKREDVSKDVSPFNLSLGLGGGVEYAIGSRTAFVAGLYFQHGLNDITNDKATIATPNPNDNPFDPNDDYLLHKEDARAVLNTLSLRIGVLF